MLFHCPGWPSCLLLNLHQILMKSSLRLSSKVCLGLFIQTPQTGRKFTISGNLRMLKWRNSGLLIIGPKLSKCLHDDDYLQHPLIILLSSSKGRTFILPLRYFVSPTTEVQPNLFSLLLCTRLRTLCNQNFFKVLSSSESFFVLGDGQLVFYIIKGVPDNLLMDILGLSETNISTMLSRFILNFRSFTWLRSFQCSGKTPSSVLTCLYAFVSLPKKVILTVTKYDHSNLLSIILLT